MKDFIRIFGFITALLAMFMTTFTLVSCGGDDDVLDDNPDVTQNNKGHVCSYEIYIDADLSKVGYDGQMLAFEDGNGKGKFSVSGDLKLSEEPTDGFLGNNGIAGYYTWWGGGTWNIMEKSNLTTSKHYTISTEKRCEKSVLNIKTYSNHYSNWMGKAVLDENASFNIRIIGYVDGNPVKDKTVTFTYSQNGCIFMGLVEDDQNEGYSYTDLLNHEADTVKW